MNRENLIKGFGHSLRVINAVVKGAGAADPTIPSNTESNLGTNAVATATRTGVGVYEIVLKTDAACPRNVQCIPHVEGASLQAFVTTKYNATTRKVIISVFTAAGVAAELTNLTAFLCLAFVSQDSSSN
jgi:hypothetical protein